MSTIEFALPAATEVGALGAYHLKRLWGRAMAARQGQALGDPAERTLDDMVIHNLGLGLEQTLQYLYQNAPTFEAFEQWIDATTGGVETWRIERINAILGGTPYPEEFERWLKFVETSEPVLTEEDLAFWEEHGYIVLHDAVSPEGRLAAEQVIWDYLGMRADTPESWYAHRNNGIMVQLFQHPALEANRRALRVHKAFAQLWGTADLWVTTDRVGFNVPERPGWLFPGPKLHWDTPLETPMPFGLQGILYLTDTPPEQGAFTCVPGFQHRLAAWLANLPPGADPQRQDLYALGPKPIGGRAGDLIIWHHALPHGSSPNRGAHPRIVQYITMHRARTEP